MKKLMLLVVLLGWSTLSPAQESVCQKGRVVWSPSCEGGGMFHYFDGGRLQRPCIGSTEQVSREKLIRYSRMGHCDFQVIVRQAEVVDGGVLRDRHSRRTLFLRSRR